MEFVPRCLPRPYGDIEEYVWDALLCSWCRRYSSCRVGSAAFFLCASSLKGFCTQRTTPSSSHRSLASMESTTHGTTATQELSRRAGLSQRLHPAVTPPHPSIVRPRRRPQLHELYPEYPHCTSQRVGVPATAGAAASLLLRLEDQDFSSAASDQKPARVYRDDVEASAVGTCGRPPAWATVQQSRRSPLYASKRSPCEGFSLHVPHLNARSGNPWREQPKLNTTHETPKVVSFLQARI